MSDEKILFEGLSNEEAAERLEFYGRNELSHEEKSTFIKELLEFFKEPVFLLLFSASLVYFALGEVRDGIIMIGFVFFMGAIELYQAWKTDKTLLALKDMSSLKVKVMRGNLDIFIAPEELVPGDILYLTEGERVAADGEVLVSDGLGADESALTGESDIVWKTQNTEPCGNSCGFKFSTHFCYCGTNIIAGRGVIRVTATAFATEFGKIGSAVREAPNRPTPLEKQTSRLVRTCSIFSLIMMLFVAAASLYNGKNLTDAALGGITIAMATIPEEFPVILTVFLAMGAWRLAKRNTLIRRIPSVETLGAVTVLCVDKTGTLTQNKMALKELLPMFDIDYSDLVRLSVLASEINPYDPMEKALLTNANEYGEDCATLQKHKLLHEYPFSSASRMMAHVFEIDGRAFVAAKGSCENIFKLCGLSDKELKHAESEQSRLSDLGCRVLAFAYGYAEKGIPSELTEAKLTLAGLAAFIDPPKDTVAASIKACSEAGIKVAMITGDNSLTAHRVAHEVGIGSAGEDEHEIITGDELDMLSDSELAKRLKSVTIFSRILPTQKMRIVQAFKASGEIVAMTGDGVNDAPALKYADIGIAMGRRGTQTAREAADMVLLDDDFTAIADTVRDGRRIFDNIRKAMAYVFVIHIPVALSALASSVLGIPAVLLPLHVVMLELIIDPTCSIVFERQQEEPDVMKRPPRDASAPIITRAVILKAAVQGLVIFAVAFGAYCFFLSQDGEDTARTFFLVVLVLSNLFLVYENRSDTVSAFSSNGTKFDVVPWVINIAVLGSLVVASAIPAFAHAAKLFPLSVPEFMAAFIVAVFAVFWWEAVKWHKRQKQVCNREKTMVR